MGRESAYSGKNVSWEFMTKQSKQDMFKHGLKIDDSIESPGPAVPGLYQLT